MPPTKLQTPKDYEELLDKFDTFLFDCDGMPLALHISRYPSPDLIAFPS